MKITDVKVFLLQKKLSSSMNISRGGFDVRNHAIIQIITDAGIVGIGEGIGNAKLVKSIVDHSLKNLVIGMDPFNIELIKKKLIDSQVYFERKGSVICAASGIEMACWDIKGKALNLPVYSLLGGKINPEFETYVSDIYWESDPKVMVKNAERMVKAGFATLKAHVGRESPEKELKRIQLLREAIGKDTKLIIDLNAGYSPFFAVRAAELWEPNNLLWLEEPVNPNLIDSYADIRTKSKIPIAGGENEFQLYGFKELFDKKAVDIAMPDIGRVGGIQEAKNICVLAEAYGITVSPHNFSSGVLLAATMHLMASTSNAYLLELDSSSNAVYEEFFLDPIEIKGSKMKISDKPGLGVALTKEIIEKYCIDF